MRSYCSRVGMAVFKKLKESRHKCDNIRHGKCGGTYRYDEHGYRVCDVCGMIL